ncbi:LCP family protein [Paenibacillus spongiae]|uniref:LCP family protein n=1 Tax=Paenibacillus spongiae TaxID=2909671 RepID=A0ABY5SFN2_9BACL|nr:LCP family protein [Paenibacillus spongiae]UVI32799.1 LCP family protein [Paenibacillus spongiae]
MSVTRSRKQIIVRRIMIVVLVVLGSTLIGVGAYAGYLYQKADNAIRNIAADPQPTQDGQEDNTANQEEADKADELKPMTFLLAGVDSREGSGGTMNSDVLMVASYNPAAHSASLLSIPRDLRIESEEGRAHKANYYYAHYSIEDKTTALANTKQMFSELLDIPITHMVTVDFDGVRQIVDTVGGLDIDVDMDMKYIDRADGTNIDLKKGYQHLDGKQVLDFVRYRKSNQGTGESSDSDRNVRQQQVLQQLLDKLASFEGAAQWGKVLDIVGQNMKTDIPEAELKDWIMNYKDMKPNQITFQQVESVWDSPYMYVNEQQFKDALTKLRTEAGIVSESSEVSDRIGTVETTEE